MPYTTNNLKNSIWPNGMEVGENGRKVFKKLGDDKIPLPITDWPEGDKLVSPFVYQDGKLVGFCDTRSMTVAGNTSIYLPYEHIDADFSSINYGELSIYAPNATVKKASWANSSEKSIPEADFKYKNLESSEQFKGVGYDVLADIANGVWSEPLWDLMDGWCMFQDCSELTEFKSDLPKLQSGYKMFAQCYSIETFSSDLSNLTDGTDMFAKCRSLSSFSSDLPKLSRGDAMFYSCIALSSFTIDLPMLSSAQSMFHTCTGLTQFDVDISNVQRGTGMFFGCENLTSFNSALSSLTDAWGMFQGCKLDTASVQNIADTINTINESSGEITIGIGNGTPNEQEEEAFNTIASNGWVVYVNGSRYTPTSPAAITTLDETGEEITRPIPYWAKPVEATEETASYVDSEGNYYNVLGAQFIYGDEISTYGMFTCEEDAAANMRLTKIERN